VDRPADGRGPRRDRRSGPHGGRPAPQAARVFQYSSSTASTVLSAIVGAAAALTGFVVTVTTLIVQMVNGTFSPRYMRLWYRDPVLKATLALLAGTLMLAFSMLRRIEPNFVPNLGVSVAGILMVADLILFLFFFSRCMSRLRPVTVAALVAKAGRAAFEEARRAMERSAVAIGPSVPDTQPTHVVRASSPGVIQAMHLEGLVRWARQHDAQLVLAQAVGDFVTTGKTLVTIYGGSRDTRGAERELTGMIALGDERTIQQDPAFAIRIMVDIALMALSPAVNAPTTATQVLGHLGETLRMIGAADLRRRADSSRGEDRPAVIIRAHAWEDYLTLGVTEIRQYGVTGIQVMRALHAMLEELREEVRPSTARPSRRSWPASTRPLPRSGATRSISTAPRSQMVRASAARDSQRRLAGRLPRTARGRAASSRPKDHQADRDHPGGKQEDEPLDVGDDEQEHQPGGVAGKDEPAGQETRAQPDGRGNKHEDGCRANCENEEEREAERTSEQESVRVGRRLTLELYSGNQRAGTGRSGKEHRGEEQAAAEEDGREEAIFALAEVAPDRSDEPDEGDPGKGNEEQSDERYPAGVLLEVKVSDLPRAAPGSGPFPDEQHRGDEEEGEHEPGDAGGTRGLEPTLGLERQPFSCRIVRQCRYSNGTSAAQGSVRILPDWGSRRAGRDLSVLAGTCPGSCAPAGGAHCRACRRRRVGQGVRDLVHQHVASGPAAQAHEQGHEHNPTTVKFLWWSGRRASREPLRAFGASGDPLVRVNGRRCLQQGSHHVAHSVQSSHRLAPCALPRLSIAPHGVACSIAPMG
jgi:uncharacterized membrane protein